jgi:ribosomal protein S27E
MKCPGQNTRYWKPGDIFDIECPACGGTVEFFKDEMRIRCRKCKKLVPNPRADFGCAEYCQYAEQCVGPELANKIREEVRQKKEQP